MYTFFQRSQNGNNWDDNIRMFVFDSPTEKKRFHERYEIALQAISHSDPSHSFLKMAEMIVCESTEHLERYLSEITKEGGEGVIIRNPLSFYEVGRTSTVLKVKRFEESEAKVIGTTENGSLICLT